MNEDEKQTLERLYWFYKMVATGGPDGSDADWAVADDARDAAVVAESILFPDDDVLLLDDDWNDAL